MPSEYPLANRIRRDHRELRSYVSPDCPGTTEVNEFGKLLEAHIRFEEREVFEPTQHRLPSTALKAIEAETIINHSRGTN